MGTAQRLSDDEARAVVARILMESGRALGAPDDIEFILRCHRDRLGAREIRRLPEYLSLLNDEGRADPKWSWFLTVGPALHALAIIRSFNNAIDAGITSFRFIPSNMLGGPCSAAAALGDRVLGWRDVEAAPLPGCTHPDQCDCRWRSEIIWDD